MDQRSLELLELPSVLRRLAGRCDTAVGQEAALTLSPETGAETVSWRLLRTEEGRILLAKLGGVPLGGVRDLRPALERAERGGMLDVAELAAVEQTLSAMRRTRTQILEGRETWPALAEDAMLLSDLPALEALLSRSLGPEGLRDEASPELGRLRREHRRLEQALRQRLEALLRNPDVVRYLQDPLITVRAGRLCIPVLREHQSRIPGVVHDASQTGQTLFIEPLFALELGNEALATLRRAQQEEERILRALTQEIARVAQPLRVGLEAVAALDLALGLGRLADEMEAVRPELLADPGLHLLQARHPLLGHPVPITVELGRARRLLVITGPNTGGKTVTLKTVGLLQLMAQCGMHIPAAEGSALAVAEEVLCDIGDEQSIEQSLSTFSSHLTAIVRILGRIGPRSLVLLDEVGAGTDPQEGAALAQAILEEIVRSKGLGLVTTHYGELKAFAYAAPGVENASMAFDPETLQPSYRLVQGAPGSSYAFVIAERLGLASEIAGRSRELLGSQRLQLDELLQRVDGLRTQLERELEATRVARRRAEEDARGLQQQRREAEREQSQIRAQLRTRLEEDVQAARRALRGAREELRAERLQERRQAALRSAKDRIDAVEAQLEAVREPPAEAKGSVPDEITPGTDVFVPQVGQQGVALSAADAEDKLWVAVGSLRLRVARTDLRLAHRRGRERPQATEGGWSALAQQKAQVVQSEISLIGMRAEEALSQLDHYLDDAELAGLETVRVIHGKGTGALRRAVHEFLQADPRVHGHRLGGAGEGGVGVTVVQLRAV